MVGLLTSQRERDVAAYLIGLLVSLSASRLLGYAPLGELRRYYGVR